MVLRDKIDTPDVDIVEETHQAVAVVLEIMVPLAVPVGVGDDVHRRGGVRGRAHGAGLLAPLYSPRAQ